MAPPSTIDRTQDTPPAEQNTQATASEAPGSTRSPPRNHKAVGPYHLQGDRQLVKLDARAFRLNVELAGIHHLHHDILNGIASMNRDFNAGEGNIKFETSVKRMAEHTAVLLWLHAAVNLHHRALTELIAEVREAREGREARGTLGSHAGHWNLMQERLDSQARLLEAFSPMRNLLPRDLTEALLSELPLR